MPHTEEELDQLFETTPEEGASEQDEILEAGPGSEEEPGQPQPEPLDIPEKFRADTPEESLRKTLTAYSEAEKRLGEMGGELGYLRQRDEETRSRLAEIETQSKKPESSFKDELARAWEEDPQQAVERLTEYFENKIQSVPKEQELKRRVEEGTQLYSAFKEQDADFRELEPKVKEVMQAYGHLISPEYRGSKEAVAIAYAIAKGTSVDHFVQKDRKRRTSVAQEKRSNFSESSAASTGGTAKNPWDMSDDEIDAAIARERKSG